MAGLVAKMRRNSVIELVDATLRDRAYDPKRASDGTTASFWPKDVIDHGDLNSAVVQALEMQRKEALMLQEARNSSGRR